VVVAWVALVAAAQAASVVVAAWEPLAAAVWVALAVVEVCEEEVVPLPVVGVGEVEVAVDEVAWDDKRVRPERRAP
jgi:hypothetical protein